MVTMSATRSVVGTVAANLVIGGIMSTCGKSCSEPIWCWLRRALAADQQHRALRAERVGHPGHRVGRARPRRHHRAPGLAGDPRVTVGGMRGHLLVADIDDLDALVDATVVDVDDVAAAEREDHIDPLGLQRLGHQVTSGDRFRCRVRWLGHSGSSRLCSPYCIPYEGNGYPHGRAMSSPFVRAEPQAPPVRPPIRAARPPARRRAPPPTATPAGRARPASHPGRSAVRRPSGCRWRGAAPSRSAPPSPPARPSQPARPAHATRPSQRARPTLSAQPARTDSPGISGSPESVLSAGTSSVSAATSAA